MAKFVTEGWSTVRKLRKIFSNPHNFTLNYLNFSCLSGHSVFSTSRIRNFILFRLASKKSSPRKAALQGIYLRGLSLFCDNIEIYYGQFLTQKKVVNLVHPINGKCRTEIVSIEEKGTDVNLASHLLDDGWRDYFDCAVVVSNDSDFAEAIRFVKRLKGKRVGIFIPFRKDRTRRSKQLRALADFNRDVRESILKRCQLPDKIPGTAIYKPKEWDFS